MTRAPRVQYAERCAQVVARLALDGPLTAQQIAAALGLQPLCAHRVIRRMLDDQRIRVAGSLDRETVRGPKPLLYGVANV